MIYDSKASTLYGMLEMLSTFSIRYQMSSDGDRKTFKMLAKAFCGQDRYLETSIGQYLAQLDHWED